jgi:hypothetical protein
MEAVPERINQQEGERLCRRSPSEKSGLQILNAIQSMLMNGSGKKQKVGRNDPCPCGSGKKFKKCCETVHSAKTPIKKLSWSELPEKVRKELQSKLRQQADWQTKFGELRPMVHADFHGYKVVGVGDQLHWSKQVKTFPDFLMQYIATTLGGDWANNELNKPFGERHQILQWYDRLCQFQRTLKRGQDGMIAGVTNGITNAFMLLAFDLYILRHHLALQKKVVKRLKDKANFQGARHELFVAATIIKAGFDIDYEDEADTSRKHPEFIAKHRESGQQVSVEAKSRHRPGVLGFDGRPVTEEEPKAGIKGLLDSALGKPTSYPYVIFIDVNLPPSPKPIFETSWFKEVVESASKAGRASDADPSPFNQLVFTNHPFHYGKDTDPSPLPSTFSAIPNNPKIPIAHSRVLIAIHEATNKFGHIPENFE